MLRFNIFILIYLMFFVSSCSNGTSDYSGDFSGETLEVFANASDNGNSNFSYPISRRKGLSNQAKDIVVEALLGGGYSLKWKYVHRESWEELKFNEIPVVIPENGEFNASRILDLGTHKINQEIQIFLAEDYVEIYEIEHLNTGCRFVAGHYNRN